MATAQDILNAAREPLNDADKTRWLDAELLRYYNNALDLLKGRRPDVFFGQYPLPGAQDLGDTVPLEAQYHPALTDYVTGRAFMKDSEDGVQGAAPAFFALFNGEV